MNKNARSTEAPSRNEKRCTFPVSFQKYPGGR
jgi:hypothetical protein